MIRFRACCAVVCALALLAPVARARAANIWLTTSANTTGAFQPPTTLSQTPLVNQRPADVGGSLFLWARPEAGLILNRWSLQIIASNPNVVRFTGAEVESYNPFLTTNANVPTANRRWDRVSDVEVEMGSLIQDGASYSILPEVNAFIYQGAVAKGIGPQSTGTPWKDLFYNSTANAWLLGRVDYRILGEGTSDIWVRVGPSGISHAGGSLSQTSLFLGATADGTVNGLPSPIYDTTSEMNALNPQKREARINVSAQHVVPNNADFDYDGDVDGADLLTLQRNLGGAPPLLRVRGDANGDGLVNGADVTIWKAQGPRPTVPPGTSVPEPRTTVVFLLGLMPAWKCRRGMLRKAPRRRFASRLAAAYMLSFALAADARATIHWTGNHSNSGAPESTYNGWGFNDNWGIGFNNATPPNPLTFNSSQVVSFNANGLNGGGNSFNTYLNGQRTIGGIEFVSAGSTTIRPGSGGPLRIAGTNINGTNGLGVTTGSGNQGTLTIDVSTTLLGSQTWSVGRTLEVFNPLDLGANTLTFDTIRAVPGEQAGVVRIEGRIEGSGSIVKNGPGELRFAGNNANTFTGYTEVNNGLLLLNKPSGDASNDYGAAVGTLYINGGIVQLSNNGQIRDNAAVGIAGGTLDLGGWGERVHHLALANQGSISGAGTWYMDGQAGDFIDASGNSSLSQTTLSIAGNSSVGVSSGTLTISSAINDWFAAGGITKSGAGNLVLAGAVANSFSGTFTLNSGGLILNKANTNNGAAVGSLIANPGTIVRLDQHGQIRDGARVDLNAATLDMSLFNDTMGEINLSNGVISGGANSQLGRLSSDAARRINSNGSSIIASNYIFADGAVLTDVASGTLAIGSIITNFGASPAAIVKSGAGTLVLSGANNYSSHTTINQGVLQLGANHVIPDSSSVVLNGGSLNLNGFGDTIGSLAGSGSVTLGGGSLAVGQNNTTTTYSGFLSGPGIFIKVGSGTMTLSGTNSHGSTRIDSGTVVISSDANLGAAASALGFNGGTLEMAPYIEMSRPVTLNANGTFDVSGFGDMLHGVIGGAGSLTKTGGGDLWLRNAGNSYQGGTILNGGRLFVRTGALGTGRITLNGGTLYTSIDSAPGNPFSSSNLVTINAGGASIDTYGNTATFSGVIDGPGALIKGGFGTLVLSGANTYGGATNVSLGILQLGNNHAIPDNSAVTLNGGALDLNGFGDTVGSLTGSGSVLLGSGSLVVGQNNSSTTYSGTLSGSGSLIKVGSGTLTLSGSNSHGSTRIDSGTVVISSDANLGAAGGALGFNGGTLQMAPYIENNRPITLNANGVFDTSGFGDMLHGAIGGLGSLVKTGGGDLWLTNPANNYQGGTQINGGRLFARNGALGSGRITFNGGQLFTSIDSGPGNPFASSAPMTINGGGGSIDTYGNTATLSGVVDGPGNLHKTGWGTLVLTNAGNLYGGGINISQHYVQGTSSSIRGPVTFAANAESKGLIFDQTFDGNYPGGIYGPGTVTKNGTGQVILTAANDYSLGTTVNAGTLVGVAGSLGTGPITVNAAGTLAIQNDNPGVPGTVANNVNGAGRLVKRGAGTLNLTGTSSLGLGATIDAGRLNVNGSLTGSVTIGAGGTLGGSGTIGGSVSGPGRFAPGNSPGVITINGDYTQNAASVLEIEAGGTTPGNGANNHDQIRVGGVVALNGRYDFSFVNGYVPAVGQSLVFIDTFDSDGAGPLPKGSVTPGTRPAESYAPGLSTNPNPNIAYRVVSDTVLDQVRLEFVDKREIFLDTNAGSVPWFQEIRWTDPATPLIDRNPDLADNTLVTNASGAAQTVTLNTVDPLTITPQNPAGNPIAQVRRLEVTDESFPITLGVDPGYLLNVTVGDAIIGNRGILELKENATTQGQLSVPTGRKVYVNGSGRLGGDGMVNGNVVVGQASSLDTATLTPGVTGAVGDLTVNGGYEQEPTGQLVIDVNGNTSNDMLEISGVADLGGSVKFNVLNAAITPGVEYPFLAAGTLNAGERFANIEISGATNMYFSVDYKYGAAVPAADGSVIAAATGGAGATYACYIVGDMNGDNVYNAADADDLAKFFVSRKRWTNDRRKIGQPSPDDRSANINGLNGSNFDDLQAFLTQFPQAEEAFNAAFAYYSATIPEPSSATLAVLVGIIGMASRRRARST